MHHNPLPVVAIILATCVLPTRAAELQMRSECRATGSLVRLGDVATIHASDENEKEKLAAIDLLPAPPTGERRLLRVREIQDLLSLRGMNLARHQFSGSSQVIVIASADGPTAETAKPLTATSHRAATVAVTQAISHYLAQQIAEAGAIEGQRASHAQPTIKLQLADEAAALVASATAISVAGGTEPWLGPQQFNLTLATPNGSKQLSVAAEVSAPESVVVATAPLAKGVLVRAGDVKLQVGKPLETGSLVFTTLEEVVGKETTRAVSLGQILSDKLVRQPLLVRGGDIVTVYSRAAGIRVKVLARAREDGSRGELVRVESLADRKPYFARVSGAQEVEVFAHAATVTTEPLKAQATASSPVVRAGAVLTPGRTSLAR